MNHSEQLHLGAPSNEFDMEGFELDQFIDETLSACGISDWDEADEERFMDWLHVHTLQRHVEIITRLTGDYEERLDSLDWLLDLKSTAPFSFSAVAATLGCKSGDLQEKTFELDGMQKAVAQMRKLWKNKKRHIAI